jgi:UDP-glucose 4-epimerase
MKKKILVTGGAGYIGSKISYDLTDHGYNVFIIDNLSTGHKFLVNKKATFYHGDILDFKLLDKILSKNKIDKIIHLAASLSVEESQNNPLKYYQNNVEGTRTLLQAAVKNNLKEIIFSSTCAVYGDVKNNKVKETDFCEPKSHYGKTKLLAELLIKNYAEKHNFSYACLRYFNVVGSDEKLRTGLINKNGQLFKNLSINLMKKNPHLEVYGKKNDTFDGSCIRDYISVGDLSKIHILSLQKIQKDKKSLILNCGYGFGYSVFEIVKLFEIASKKSIELIIKPKRQGDITSIYSDTTFFKKIFKNVKFFTPIKDIINSCLRWEKLIKSKKF